MFGNRRDLSFRLVVVGAPLDADQQFLVEDGEDALEHGDGGDVVAGFQFRDERVGSPCMLGDLLLGELELVAALPMWAAIQFFSRSARIAAYSSRASW